MNMLEALQAKPKEKPATKDDRLESLARMSRDLANKASTMTRDEVRFMVDAYYTIQEHRIAMSSQLRELSRAQEPHAVFTWLASQQELLENQVRRALDKWTEADPLASWAKSILGIGPVISAGLRAHIDTEKVRSYGQIWTFAGLNPTALWVSTDKATTWINECLIQRGVKAPDGVVVELAAKAFGRNPVNLLRAATTNKDGEAVKLTASTLAKAISRRPWNESLKTLATYKLGESFVKVSGNDASWYGAYYRKTKDALIAKNEAGDFKDDAKAKLEKFNIGKDTDAYKAYSIGKLPPAHIHARARRIVVKLFLSHYFEAGCVIVRGVQPPEPWPIAHGGHVDWVKYTDVS